MSEPIIKFRGLRTDNNEWVYGYYVFADYKPPTVSAHFIFPHDCRKYSIIPGTVGQFTGLYDKNDKEIYVGDKLKDGWWYENNVGIVTFEAGGFNCNLGYIENQDVQVRDSELIGNIYENI